MLRNFFVCKIQCELSCPKSTQKDLGLLKNARQVWIWIWIKIGIEIARSVKLLLQCKKQLSSDEVKSSFNHASPFNLSEILFVGGIWPTSVAFPMLPGVDRIGCYDLIKIQFNCNLTPVLNMNLD